MKELTQETITQLEKGKVILDFWAPWCAPCRMQIPICEQSSKKHQDIRFYKVNVDENPSLASSYDVRGIPCIVFIKEGQIVDQHSGLLDSNSLQQKISTHFT